MTDLDVIDLDDSRPLRTNIYDTVGRRLLRHPQSFGSYPVGGEHVKEAGDMIQDSDGEWVPKVVGLKLHDDNDDRDYQPSLVFINRDAPDDVIVICPRDAEAMDDD